MSALPTSCSWINVLQSAYRIFDDLETRGFGRPPFSLGGGTVLMLHFKHRLSKDIDLFGYDAQWLSLVSPRLNDYTAALASGYVEQANTVKIVMPHGDIDFIIAGDVTRVRERTRIALAGRATAIEPTSEILAKKMFYRASIFKARDVYDVSAAIDLAPQCAREAVQACATKKAILLQRLSAMADLPEETLTGEITPYEGFLAHGRGMVRKVIDFIVAECG